MGRLRTAFAAILATGLCLAPVAQAQRQSLDDVLNAYLGGDLGVIQRTFVRSIDFQDRLYLKRPRDLDRWLGSWNPGKAVFLLELARASSGVAPQYVSPIVNAGRRYVATARSLNGEAARGIDFHRVWNRVAAGVLQGATGPTGVEEHVKGLSGDPRLVLAHGIAQESRCWADRPSLNQPAVPVDGLLSSAGVRVANDIHTPVRSEREGILSKHSECLREAVVRFDAAAQMEDVATEARVRGGWVLLQDGRAAEAIAWLDAVMPQDDRDLEYWHALFRGRALAALGRFEDAVHAYRAALALQPGAQSAGVGLSIALLRLYRNSEADEIARSVREAPVAAADPWLHYPRGDDRFIPRWMTALRTAAR